MSSLPSCALFSRASFLRHENVFGGVTDRTSGCCFAYCVLQSFWSPNVLSLWSVELLMTQHSRKKEEKKEEVNHEEKCTWSLEFYPNLFF